MQHLGPGPDDAAPQRSERAHYVRVPTHWIAGCSDTGLRHRTNQDAMCLATREQPTPAAVLAVADGVTTAPGAEIASVIAAETVVEELVGRIRTGQAANVAFVQAFASANRAVLEARDEPSACTLIAALIDDGAIAVGNVGDSRAYWLGDDGLCQLLSTDDSMAQARMMLGMSRDDAEKSSQAHAITKWLGRNSTNFLPSVITMQPTTNGWLLLCSDGLWNYASSPDAMWEVFADQLRQGPAPRQLAEGLVAWANAQGGKDNVTVVVARIEV